MLKEIVIRSPENPLVKHLVKVRSQKKWRREHQSILVVGRKLVMEALKEAPPKLVVVSEECEIPSGVDRSKLAIVTGAIFKKISGQESPEGWLAEIAMPEESDLHKIDSLVVCDGIADPGNLGTIIRTGVALGWKNFYLLGNSVDLFNEKTIRAASGALLRCAWREGEWDDLKEIALREKLQPIVADMTGVDLSEIKGIKRPCLVLASEAHGISEEAQSFGKKVMIPMEKGSESLNVAIAGGILMYTIIAND